MTSTDFLEAIHIPFQILKFFGCFWTDPTSSSKDDGRYSLSKIRSLLVSMQRFFFVILHLVNITRSISFEVYAIMQWDSSMAFFAQFYFIMFFCSVIYFVELVATKYYARPVFQTFMKYNLEYSFRGNLHRCKKIYSYASIAFITFFFLSQLLLASIYLFWFKEDMHFVYYPYRPTGGGFDIALGYAISLAVFLWMVIYGGYFILYTLFVEMVSMELRLTKDELMNAFKLNPLSCELHDSFLKVRDRHRYLIGMVTKVSQLIRYFGAMGLLITLAEILFVLYVLGNGQSTTEQTILELIMLFSVPSMMFFICWRWGALPASASSVIDAIRSAPLNELSAQLLQQIQLFQTEVLMSKTGIDIFGLFTYDSSTILMIFGTVLTYGILVFQTGQGTGGDCHCICNTTSV